MDRLGLLKMREAGLMTLRHPNLVKRYNDALARLCNGLRTELAEFRIDAVGFSPDIAAELGNPDYMNPEGTRLRYILVSIRQAELAVLNQRFTNARWLLRSFVEGNQSALFALTTKDAVYGEIDDDTYKIRNLEDLLSIRHVTFSVQTPSGLGEKARALADMVSKFPSSSTMWLEEGTIERMCEYARVAGDVRRNPSVPTALTFDSGSFHTTLLGGVYLFRGQGGTAVIHQDPRLVVDHEEGLPGAALEVIDISDVGATMGYLARNGLVQPLDAAFVLARRETLLRKLEFLVIDHVSAVLPDADLHNIDFEQTKRLIYRYHDELPQEFHQISRALKFCAQGMPWSPKGLLPTTLAYMCAPTPGINRDLVSHLLACLCPADYFGAFSSNNALFMERFDTWNPARQGYVLEFLNRRLTSRSAALFATVYGADDPMGAEISQEGVDAYPGT